MSAGYPTGIPVRSEAAYPSLALAPQVAELVSRNPEAAPGLVRPATAAGYPPSNSAPVAPTLSGKASKSSEVAPALPVKAGKSSEHAQDKRSRSERRSSSSSRKTPTGVAAAASPLRPGPRQLKEASSEVQASATSPTNGRPRVARPPQLPPSPTGSAPGRKAGTNAQQPELTLDAVLQSAGQDASEGVQDVVQVIFRRKGLKSLCTPNSIDFSELVSLRMLSLSHNELTEIGPVADLPSLQELNVSYNRLQDLSPAAHCEHLQVLLAANNQIASVKGLEELQQLQRLSVYSNAFDDLDKLVENLQAFPCLKSLDLGGNSCFSDAAHHHAVVRALPSLKELDGEALAVVDRQLATEFFMCAEELGLEERPGTACGLRPKTAPVQAKAPPPVSEGDSRCSGSGHRARSPFRSVSRPSSRPPSGSPDARSDIPQPPTEQEADDPSETIQNFTSYVDALQLRLQTTQVECENLQRNIKDLKKEAKEPILGVGEVRQRFAEFEAANHRMHEQAEENRRARLELERKEAAYAEQRQALGLPAEDLPGKRPGSSARPRTAQAAVEAVLNVGSQLPQTAAELKARCRVLRQELDWEREQTQQLRAVACSRVLGRDISPPPTASRQQVAT